MLCDNECLKCRRVAFAFELHDPVFRCDVQPDLAGATAHLVGFVAKLFRIGREAASEINDVFIALVPIVEKLKVSANVFEVCHWTGNSCETVPEQARPGMTTKNPALSAGFLCRVRLVVQRDLAR